MPVRLCFQIEAEGWWWLLEATISLVFLCDLALTFNTSYIEDGEWVTSRSAIAKKYLSGGFWVDAPSSIPVELIELAMETMGSGNGGSSGVAQNLAAFRVLRILRILRVTRLLNLRFYIASVTTASNARASNAWASNARAPTHGLQQHAARRSVLRCGASRARVPHCVGGLRRHST